MKKDTNISHLKLLSKKPGLSILSGVALFSVAWFGGINGLLHSQKEEKGTLANGCVLTDSIDFTESIESKDEGRSFFVSCAGFLE